VRVYYRQTDRWILDGWMGVDAFLISVVVVV